MGFEISVVSWNKKKQKNISVLSEWIWDLSILSSSWSINGVML